MTLTDSISNLEADNLRFKNEIQSLTATNTLLQDQVDQLTETLAACRKENLRKDEIHQMQIDHMTYQRDSAIRRADEVRTLIVGIGKMALDGVQKMREDEAARPDLKADFQPPAIAEASSPPRLPPVSF